MEDIRVCTNAEIVQAYKDVKLAIEFSVVINHSMNLDKLLADCKQLESEMISRFVITF